MNFSCFLFTFLKCGSITFGQNLALETAQYPLTSTPISPKYVHPFSFSTQHQLVLRCLSSSPVHTAGPSSYSSPLPPASAPPPPPPPSFGFLFWLRWSPGPTLFLQSFSRNPAKLFLAPPSPAPRVPADPSQVPPPGANPAH